VLEIDIPTPTLHVWEKEEKKTRFISEKLDPNRILYEDNELLIYDKPA